MRLIDINPAECYGCGYLDGDDWRCTAEECGRLNNAEKKIKDTFRERLKGLLEERGINQRTLSLMVNVTEVSISRYVNGERIPRINILSAIAKALGTTSDYLLGLEDRKYSSRKVGRWIDGKVKHVKNGELRNVRQCSVCGSSYFVYDNYNSIEEIPKYCPNCGADMRGGEWKTL